MEQEQGGAATAATSTDDTAEATYRRGMDALGHRPELLAAVERAATRAQARLGDMGEITAETTALTIDALARVAGERGLPADDDAAAALVASLAKTAARRARDMARGQWAPRMREARPSEAPNRIERWNTDALVTRASRYTMGALTTREQAQAVMDARHEYAWPIVHRVARVARTLPNGERVTTSERVGGAICAPRHSGSTSPAAESVWARERDAVRVRAAMGATMGADTVDAVADAYRGERRRRIRGRGKRVGDITRARRVGWARVAAGMGAARGTVYTNVRRDAARVAPMVAAAEREEARRMAERARYAATDGRTRP